MIPFCCRNHSWFLNRFLESFMIPVTAFWHHLWFPCCCLESFMAHILVSGIICDSPNIVFDRSCFVYLLWNHFWFQRCCMELFMTVLVSGVIHDSHTAVWNHLWFPYWSLKCHCCMWACSDTRLGRGGRGGGGGGGGGLRSFQDYWTSCWMGRRKGRLELM